MCSPYFTTQLLFHHQHVNVINGVYNSKDLKVTIAVGITSSHSEQSS